MDPAANVSGVAHVMLPSGPAPEGLAQEAKFATSGVEKLVDKMVLEGAQPESIRLALVGGAQMMTSGGALLTIGERNVEAARAKVAELGLQIVGEDVGGVVGRAVKLMTSTGSVRITISGEQERQLCSLRLVS